jgi:hypothetical protein
MNIYKRLEALEKRFIREPTILFMPDGKIFRLTGPGDYLLTLLGLTTRRDQTTPQQAAHLDLIQNCDVAQEPGGSRLIELIKCFQAGPRDYVVKSESPAGLAGTEVQANDGGQPASEKAAT